MPYSKKIALSLVFLLIVSPCIRADVIPEGRRIVSVELTLDLGAWVDQSWTSHTIIRGDSFSSISEAHYGTATRADEIAKANPKVVAKKMKIGTRLELPPKKTFRMKDGKKVPLTALCFYWWPDPGLNHYAPQLVENKMKIRNPRYSGFLISFPHAKKKVFEDAIKIEDREKSWKTWKGIEGLVYSDKVYGRKTVPVASATKLIKTNYTLTGLTKKKMTLAKKELKFDDKGEIVTWKQTAKLPLLAVSGLGMLLFAGLCYRRRSQCVEAAE